MRFSILRAFLGVLCVASLLGKGSARADDNGSRGDGGGGFLCAGENGEQKLLSADFVFTAESVSERKPVHAFAGNSCESNIEEIRARLARTDPILAEGLAGFAKSFFQKVPGTPARAWIPGCERIGCLSQIPDDRAGGLKVGGKCARLQLARRVESAGRIETHYDQRAMELLLKDPLQCSYFFVHEWLRDIFPNAGEIRSLTHLLHQQGFHAGKSGLGESSSLSGRFPFDKTPFSCQQELAGVGLQNAELYPLLLAQVEKLKLGFEEESSVKRELHYYPGECEKLGATEKNWLNDEQVSTTSRACHGGNGFVMVWYKDALAPNRKGDRRKGPGSDDRYPSIR